MPSNLFIWLFKHVQKYASFISVHCRDVQQSGNAELTAADLGKPSANAEHAICSLHAQYDAVAGSEPRVGLPGMKQWTPTLTRAYTQQIEDTHRHLAVVRLESKLLTFFTLIVQIVSEKDYI